MTIGAAWNVDDPKRPWADFDPDANIPIPIGLAEWIADLGTTYGTHDILTATPLECVEEGVIEPDAAGTVRVRMRLIPAAPYTPGTKYPFTVRVFGADGQTRDDRTFFLRVKNR